MNVALITFLSTFPTIRSGLLVGAPVSSHASVNITTHVIVLSYSSTNLQIQKWRQDDAHLSRLQYSNISQLDWKWNTPSLQAKYVEIKSAPECSRAELGSSPTTPESMNNNIATDL